MASGVEERRNCVAFLDFSVGLHRSKPLISLVLFNLHFHCFQGQGHCYVTIPIVFPANQKHSFKLCRSTLIFLQMAQEARELIKNRELNLYVSCDHLSHHTKIIISR